MVARLSRWRERDRACRQQLIANETPEEEESCLMQAQTHPKHVLHDTS